MNFRIDVEQDSATPMLHGMQKGLADRKKTNRAAVEAMLPLVQEHLLHMAQTNHNVFGVRSSFWNDMLSATHTSSDGDAGILSMPSAVHLRAEGGTVVPTEAENLAIPARTEAYGKSPRDFNDLRLIIFGSGTLALVQQDQQAIKYGRKHKDGSRTITPGEVKGGEIYFWLVPEATIEGDPDVLPTEEELGEAAEQGVVDYIGLLSRRAS